MATPRWAFQWLLPGVESVSLETEEGPFRRNNVPTPRSPLTFLLLKDGSGDPEGRNALQNPVVSRFSPSGRVSPSPPRKSWTVFQERRPRGIMGAGNGATQSGGWGWGRSLGILGERRASGADVAE